MRRTYLLIGIAIGIAVCAATAGTLSLGEPGAERARQVNSILAELNQDGR